LTVAVAFIGAHLKNAEDYLVKKASVCNAARAIVCAAVNPEASVELNAADAPPDSLYLTVTGSSAEAGDDGEAGRGNRANGLITPYRPMTMECVAGKNPVNHVGKLYNLAAGLIADDLVRQVDEIDAAECYLVSQIGRPIGQPQIIEARLRPAVDASVAGLGSRIEEIVMANLERLDRFADDLLDGGSASTVGRCEYRRKPPSGQDKVMIPWSPMVLADRPASSAKCASSRHFRQVGFHAFRALESRRGGAVFPAGLRCGDAMRRRNR
jgi:S-adenosylmethionine synthetase